MGELSARKAGLDWIPSDIIYQKELKNRGLIYKGSHSGWYSVSDESFFTESQVSSRVDPKSGETYTAANETGNRVEWTQEVNYKFRLSAFRKRLLEHFEQNPNGEPFSTHKFTPRVGIDHPPQQFILRSSTNRSWAFCPLIHQRTFRIFPSRVRHRGCLGA